MKPKGTRFKSESSPKISRKKKVASANRTPSLEAEIAAGFPKKLVAGVDEVGRGCLFGPVVTAAVVLPANVEELLELEGYAWVAKVRDSKLLKPREREELAPLIRAFVEAWFVAEASPAEIDLLNIHHATLLAMKRAAKGLSSGFDHVIVDGKFPIPGLASTAWVKGDQRSLSIACASILAKVYRDQMMVDLSAMYPGYGLEVHKGYPTPEHKRALEVQGPTVLHRRSFQSVSEAPQPTLFDAFE